MRMNWTNENSNVMLRLIRNKFVLLLPLLICLAWTAQGQTKVQGKVTDEVSEPLIGVNIQVKGTDKGAATDFEGNFTLEDIDENALLVVSYVGYQTKEVMVAGKSNLTKAAKSVIDMNQYSLFPDYRGLFMLENEGNSEVIFDVQYAVPEFTVPWDIIIELQINVAPTLDLVNSYHMKDGKSIQESSLYDPDQPYENRDPRLHQTVVIPGYMYRGGIVPDDKYFSTGYGFKKYTTYKDDVSQPNIIDSEINFIVLRYADVLLMYAESQNEASGPDPSVYNALNKIRMRVGMPEITPGLSKDQMREVIRQERRIELAGEGLYYHDIRRWRTAEIVMNADVWNSKGEVLQSRSFNPQRDYLWPIHETTIQENPALKQNPGY